MNPTHSNPTRQDRVARAPYNFVPLPEQIVPVDYEIPAHDRYTGYTGYIECTLTTLTPVYTRAALDPEFFARWAENIREMMGNDVARGTYARFFQLDDAYRPVIPGSSLRGMVRGLVEIVAYGKIQWVTEQCLFFRSLDETAVGKHYRNRMVGKVESGFLRKRGEEYYIKKCSFARVDRRTLGGVARIYDGDPPNRIPKWSGQPSQYVRVWIPKNQPFVKQVEYARVDGWEEGRLVITGDVPKKKKEFIFLLPQEDAEEIAVPSKLIQRFHDEDQITQWQERAFPKDRPKRGCRDRDGALRSDLEDEGDPVFFLRENGKLTFFGRAQMFRLPYDRSPLDLVPASLRGKKVLDLAEAIFGYVAEGERTAGRAGRVYFTDAICEPHGGDVWLSEQPITPKVLATPKPTTFQHYLVQPRDGEHDPDDKRKLAHYGATRTVIRGHKLYWHKKTGSTAEYFAEQGQVDWARDKQHTQIRPVAGGVKFRFRIDFENLTDVELGALLWVLDLPQGHHHKIGMGKPLGLGSVAITPRLVLTNRSERYQRLFDGNGWYAAEHREGDFGRFKEAFERYVLGRIDKVERRNAEALKEVPRIQVLLKMLQYPGPAAETDYMQLQPRNEFKDRPVLPNPLNVGSK